MSSVYLVLANVGIQNPIFKTKGIADKMPGKVSDMPIFGFPNEKMSGFDALLTILPGLLMAQHTGTGTFIPADSYNVFSKLDYFPGLQFNPPYAIFEFPGISSEDEKTVLEAGLVPEPSKESAYGGCPSYESMNSLWRLSPQSKHPHPGYASPEAVLAYLFLTKGMALYAVASHGMSQDKSAFCMISPGSHDVLKEGETSKSVQIQHLTTSSTITFNLAVQDVHLMEKAKMVPIAVPVTDSRNFLSGYTTSTTPRLPGCPTGGGRFFPYFEGMLLPDKHSAYQVFSDLFFNCLFDDQSKAPDLMNLIRKGCHGLANKPAGMALSHAYAGIKLSKQTHSKITFIISRKEYQGFVLEGDFTVCVYGAQYKPIPQAELFGDIAGLNTHEKTLGLICDLIERPKRVDGTPIYPCVPGDIDTSFKFVNKYKTLSLPDFAGFEDFSKDLRKLVDDLDYEELYEPLTYTSFISFLRFVSSNDDSFIRDKPTWFRGGFFERANSRVAQGLAVYGNYAPTINTGKADDLKFTIPKLTAEDHNLRTDKDGKRSLRYLPVRKTGLDNALGHWNRLFEKGVLHLPKATKGSGRFTTRQGVLFEIAKDDEFSLAYRLIKEHISTIRNSRGNKRTIGEIENAEAGPSESRKKKDRMVTFDG